MEKMKKTDEGSEMGSWDWSVRYINSGCGPLRDNAKWYETECGEQPTSGRNKNGCEN